MISLVNNLGLGSKKSLIMEFFLKNPSKEIHIRSLARTLKVSSTWVLKATRELAENNLLIITKDPEIIEVLIKANRENNSFKSLKQSYNLYSIKESRLLDYLIKKYKHPECIILFGSYSKGEDIEGSDIDIGIITGKSIKNDVRSFEKILERQINIHELKKERIQKEFWNTLSNGIVIDGYLDVK